MKIDKINDHLVKVGKKVTMVVAALIEEAMKRYATMTEEQRAAALEKARVDVIKPAAAVPEKQPK